MVNGGLVYNWCALYLCICNDFSSDKALTRLGILRGSKEGTHLREHPNLVYVDVDKAYGLYKSGLTMQEVADNLNVAAATLRKRFTQNGIKTRGRGANKSKIIKEMYV